LINFLSDAVDRISKGLSTMKKLSALFFVSLAMMVLTILGTS
jgi:hypothetical protein